MLYFLICCSRHSNSRPRQQQPVRPAGRRLLRSLAAPLWSMLTA